MRIPGDKSGPPLRPSVVQTKGDTNSSNYISALIAEIKSKNKSKLVSDAIEFAKEAHKEQFRKGTSIPYIVHPLRVALTLIEYNCSDEVIAAGILHDTIEDSKGDNKVTYDDIKHGFGQYVADLVQGASEPDKSDTWENRKQHTIEYLKTAPKDILFVVCADKLDNISSIWEELATRGEDTWASFKRGREQQKWYFESLSNVLISRIDDATSSHFFHRLKTFVDHVFN